MGISITMFLPDYEWFKYSNKNEKLLTENIIFLYYWLGFHNVSDNN